MKKLTSLILLIFICMTVSISAHPGSLDENGGHYNRKTGEYHYHDGTNTGSGGSTSSSSNIKYKDTIIEEPPTVYLNDIESSVKKEISNVNVNKSNDFFLTIIKTLHVRGLLYLSGLFFILFFIFKYIAFSHQYDVKAKIEPSMRQRSISCLFLSIQFIILFLLFTLNKYAYDSNLYNIISSIIIAVCIIAIVLGVEIIISAIVYFDAGYNVFYPSRCSWICFMIIYLISCIIDLTVYHHFLSLTPMIALSFVYFICFYTNCFYE